MAQQDPVPGAGGATKCSAKDLLDEVTKELFEFEAKKLTDLRSELDAFVKKQEALVADYKKQYPALRTEWCKQQLEVESLYSSVQCHFPDGKWKEIVKKCICSKQKCVDLLDEKIRKRERCCSGANERARDRAKARLDAAKARLDALAGNTEKVTKELSEDKRILGEISALWVTSEKAQVLHPLIFKLLPTHKRLRPFDVSKDCKEIPDDLDPKKVCEGATCDGWVDEKGCAPTTVEEEPDPTAEADDKECPRKGERPEAPSLMDPDLYQEELDRAWRDFRKARDAHALADSAFKAAPDDLASLKKKLEEERKKLEEEIKKCLKGEKPDDKCCTEPPGKKCGCGHTHEGQDGKGVTGA